MVSLKDSNDPSKMVSLKDSNDRFALADKAHKFDPRSIERVLLTTPQQIQEYYIFYNVEFVTFCFFRQWYGARRTFEIACLHRGKAG